MRFGFTHSGLGLSSVQERDSPRQTSKIHLKSLSTRRKVRACAESSIPRRWLPQCTRIVYTIFVRQKTTFDADRSCIKLAREEVESQNTTITERFRGWLKRIAGRVRARKYRALMNELRYTDAGRKFARDEMNER